VSINDLIDRAVRCTSCGVQGVGTCGCWDICTCGEYRCDSARPDCAKPAFHQKPKAKGKKPKAKGEKP
jgi:hypothetical protein